MQCPMYQLKWLRLTHCIDGHPHWDHEVSIAKLREFIPGEHQSSVYRPSLSDRLWSMNMGTDLTFSLVSFLSIAQAGPQNHARHWGGFSLWVAFPQQRQSLLLLCPLSFWRPWGSLLSSENFCHINLNILNIIFCSSRTVLRAGIYPTYMS